MAVKDGSTPPDVAFPPGAYQTSRAMKRALALPLCAALLFAAAGSRAIAQAASPIAPPPASTETPLVPDPFAGSSIVAYQVGAFLNRKNTDALVDKLGTKDIVGHVYPKTVRGVAFWVVAVTVSGIPYENLPQELLAAGCRSFPIRKTDHPLADLIVKEREEGPSLK